MLCCFISSTSASIVSRSSARPVSGCHSCRLTPRSRIGRPLTVNTPSTIATVRNPIRTDTVSSGVDRVNSYSRGDSAVHGSIKGTEIGPT